LQQWYLKLRFPKKSKHILDQSLNRIVWIWAVAYWFSFIIIKAPLFSTDSDLEAFSHNPTDGSFTALPMFRQLYLPIIWTNCSSRTKLDYCRGTASSVG